MSEFDVRIKKLIVHIIDNISGVPLISEQEHPTNKEINEFIEKHITKSLNDDGLKKTNFINEPSKIKDFFLVLKKDYSQFTNVSKEVALNLQDIIVKYSDIPSADLACCLFSINEVEYFGILKFNYKPSYIHYVQQTEQGNINSIIKQKTALPNETSRLEECVFINLQDFTIDLIEKKFELDGQKDYYLSTQFLKCTSQLSPKEKVKILDKTTKTFIDENYGEEELNKYLNFKEVVLKNIENTNEVNINNVADAVFKHSPENKASYLEEIEKKGLNDKIFKISEKLTSKTFKKQKIVTDTGIEINLPLEDFNDKEKVEIINNPDGTISIVLKNIKGIKKNN